MDSIALAQQVASILYDKKAQDIVALNVGHMTVIADCMVIATGRSAIQVKTLADEVDEKLSAQGIEPRRMEGHNEGRWIVIDYGFVIVHIFHQEERAFYNLERLWEDGSNRLVLPFNQDEE
jgi:iojap-like ribosome-associated protein